MATFLWLPKGDMVAHFLGPGQGSSGDKRVIERIQQQRGYPDRSEMGLGRSPVPIVVGVAKPVHGRREDVVEGVQIPCFAQGLAIKQARVLLQLAHRLGDHRAQKHACVHLPIESSTNGMATGRQIQGRAHRCHRAHRGSRRLPVLTRPSHQGVSAQGYAHRQSMGVWMAFGEALQQPVDLLVISRVVRPGRQIQLSRTAPEMGHRQAHAGTCSPVGKTHRILAGR